MQIRVQLCKAFLTPYNMKRAGVWRTVVKDVSKIRKCSRGQRNNVKTLEILVFLRSWASGRWAKLKNILWLTKNLQKPCANHRFSPPAVPERAWCQNRATARHLAFALGSCKIIGNPWVSRGAGCMGSLAAYRASCGLSKILRLAGNVGKPLGFLMFPLVQCKGTPAELKVTLDYSAAEIKMAPYG